MKEKLSETEWKILDVLDRNPASSIPVSIGDLVNEDFCNLTERDLVGMRRTGFTSIDAFITPKGRAALEEA